MTDLKNVISLYENMVELRSIVEEEPIGDTPAIPEMSVDKRSPKAIFYLIQAFLSFGENLGYQYLPIYTRRLGATETQMGLLTSVQNVSKTIFQPSFGRMSDKYGRKKFMLIGAFIAMTASTIMAFAQNPVQVIVAIGFNAFGISILFPAWQGAIADYTHGLKRGGFMGRLLGVSYIYISLALISYVFLVPLVATEEIQQFRLIIIMAAVNFALVAFMSYILIDIRHLDRPLQRESIFTPLKDPVYRKFLAVVLYWWFFMSLAWSYFPLVIADVVKATPIEVAYMAITATVIQAFASYRLADHIDRFGERKSISIGFVSFTVVPLTYAFATEWWHVIPAQMISGIGIGFGFTALRSYIIEIGGSKRAGNYQGIYQLLWGIVTFTGSFSGGLLLDWYVDYLGGDISKALTTGLLIIAAFRLSSNIIIYKFLPEPISGLQEQDIYTTR